MQQLRKVVIIGGRGHVGLPLGIVFANCGLDVVLFDREQAGEIAEWIRTEPGDYREGLSIRV